MKFEGKSIIIKPLDKIETKEDGGRFWNEPIVEKLKFLFSELNNPEKNPQDTHKEIRSEIEYITNNSDYAFLTILQEFFGEADSTNYESMLETFLDKLENTLSGKLDESAIIIAVLSRYEEYCLSLYETMNNNVELLKTDFKRVIHMLISTLGDEYDLSRVDEIVNGIGVNFFTANFYRSKKQNSGSYSPKHKINIKIDNGVVSEEYKHVVFHELLHAISSDLTKIFSYDSKWISNNDKNMGTQSSGIMFQGMSAKRFVWLNEAITENIAIDLSNFYGKKLESSSYIKERNLLATLSAKKKRGSILNLNLFSKTYFRHLKINDDNETTAYTWKEFNDTFDNAFCPRFLVKLDLFIEKYGIDRAIEIISNWEDGNPNTDEIAYPDW